MKYDQLFDRKFLYKCLATLAMVCVAMKVSGGSLFLLFIPAILSSVLQKKTEKLLFWLVVSICVIIVNYNIAPKNSVFAISQRIILVIVGVCMAVQVFGRRSHPYLAPFMGMLLYIMYMIIPSITGWCPIISFLKLFLFTIIYFALLGSVNLVGIDNTVSSRRVRSIMLTFAIFFLLGSIALSPFPGLSQMRAEAFLEAQARGADIKSLYCGMANHSQCLGPVVSALGIVLLGDLLFSVKRAHPLYIVLLLTCPYLLYKTSSRTGMGAFILGMLFVIYLFMQSKGVSARWKSKVMSLTMAMLAVGGACVLAMPKFSEGINKFVTKSTSVEEVTTEQVFMSRNNAIEGGLRHFHESPLFGNGFQVGENMKGFTVSDIRQILSAPIEKGVWVFAVLEEGGAFGWAIFVIFFITCILRSIHNRAYVGAAGLFTMLMTNLGEFTIFSMSYSGGFCWAMVFMGLALDIRRNEDEKKLSLISPMRGRL